MTPSASEVTSVSTLSVAISNMGSSIDTESPTFFNHLVIVASATLSPILGNFKKYCPIILCYTKVSNFDGEIRFN